MTEELSHEDMISSKTRIKDILWWSPKLEKTLQAYLDQKDQLIYDISKLKGKDNITTKTKDKIYIPKNDIEIDEDTDKVYIPGKNRPTEFKSYPSEMTISSPSADFIINFQEHNYIIIQRKLPEEYIAETMTIDVEIQKILNRYNYNTEDIYETDDKRHC